MPGYRNVLLPKCLLPKRPLPKCPLPKCLDTVHHNKQDSFTQKYIICYVYGLRYRSNCCKRLVIFVIILYLIPLIILVMRFNNIIPRPSTVYILTVYTLTIQTFSSALSISNPTHPKPVLLSLCMGCNCRFRQNSCSKTCAQDIFLWQSQPLCCTTYPEPYTRNESYHTCTRLI